MSIASTQPLAAIPVPFVNMGDVLTRLPDIPPSRIRLVPTPGTAREDDVIRVHAQEKRLCEIFDGVLVEKGMGHFESILAGYILTAINNYLDQYNRGLADGEASMLRIAAGQVRMPDVSFVSWEQLPGRKIPEEPIWGTYPDLAVEVLSDSNTAREIERKLTDYFTAGTRLAWIVDPPTKTIRVYTSAKQFKTLALTDTLDGGEVLPGFTMPLNRVFRI